MTGTQVKNHPQEKRKGRNPLYQTPLGILLSLSFIIFLVESMIMLAIALYHPHLSLHLLTILDPLLLVLLLSPALYFLVFRPMMITHNREQSRAEQEKQGLQEQLVQSQKLESLGVLAGGVAHDFNNTLTAVIGYADLALNQLPMDHPVREYLLTILEGGEKAVALTRQLLAFGRKQVLDMKAVNLNRIIENLTRMLTILIGEQITLELNTKTPVRNVLADPGQIEQVLMNLAINARDAMPGGGRLIIETMDIEHGAGDAGKEETRKPGSYVMMSITDTGQGMSREIQEKIFEPFFTTKEIGKGTGLGLSTVYGIVNQHGGHIAVYSEPGQGTTFKVCLPAARSGAEETAVFESIGMMPGTETIMVVDDEPSILRLIIDVLQPLGYQLIGASGSQEALEISKTFSGTIDLLLTDVFLPEMSGQEMAQLLLVQRPEMRVAFMSGYSKEIMASGGMPDLGLNFLQKPLTPLRLTKEVRSILDQKR